MRCVEWYVRLHQVKKHLLRQGMNDIKKYMEEGLFWGYIQLCELLDRGDFHLKIVEYLFTVNVAQSLLAWAKEQRKGKRGYFSVNLEYNAGWFFENAFKITTNKGKVINKVPIPTDFKRRKHTGRMDIAVTERNYSISLPLGKVKGRFKERSIYGVEIKGINPNKSELLKDFIRLAQCVSNIDPIGENNIKECFILYAKRLGTPQKPFLAKDLPDKNEIRKKEIHIFSENNFFKEVDVHVDPFDIYTYLSEDFAKNTPVELWDGFDPNETGSVWGIIITIRRKLSNHQIKI